MNILILATLPLSLKDWEKAGILEREIQLYNEISSRYNINFKILTFGDESDLKFQELLGKNKIIPSYVKLKKPKNYFLQILHSFLIPIYLKKDFINADFIQTNQFWGCWLAIFAKIFYKKKFILRSGFEFYDFFLKKYDNFQKKNFSFYVYNFLLKFFATFAYRISNSIIITTDLSAEFIHQNFKIKKSKINVIPNFINTEIFKRDEKIKKNDRLLFIGRLSNQKGIELLFDAIKNLNIGIDIIGGGKGNLRNKYEIIAKNLRIDARFYTNIPNKKLVKYYNECNIFILSSSYEGNPKTLLEAMSCECAIICTKVDGIKNIVNSDNCKMINLNSLELTHAIDNLRYDEVKKVDLGKQARKYILSNNKIDIVIEKFYQIYQKV